MRYMNHVTSITVIRNSGLKIKSIILLDFQIFLLARKKHNTIFDHSDLKCSFIKLPINTSIFYCIKYTD